ncbi:hypothetical protein [Streptomyces sp. NPDC059861]|uniref:hypothetical protein n=1 Tax=Streptomyces sp. NPDC059861 TaxID=3346974 RepID=UPI00364D19CD
MVVPRERGVLADHPAFSPSRTTVSAPAPCTVSVTSCSPADTAPYAETQAGASFSTGGGPPSPAGRSIK